MKCLILGGGGPVGVALLYLLKRLEWTAAVVDPLRPRHFERHLSELAGTLLGWQQKYYAIDDLRQRLRQERFDVVFDLTPTLDKRHSLSVCDEANVSLINSTMVDYKDDIHIAAFNFLDDRPKAIKKGHVVASGMNPGAVNAMAELIIAKHGQPDSIVYWEYDDSVPADGILKQPATTWCQGESHAEITLDWNFEVLEEGTVLLHEDALSWEWEDFGFGGVPLDTLPIPSEARAFLIGHEECVYMGWRHDTKAKFIYGFHPRNMALMKQAGHDAPKPELLVNEPGRPIMGRDIVGVSCQYEGEEDDDPDSWYGLYCMLGNSPSIAADTNATCVLVAAGIAASAQLVSQGMVPPGVHLTHELPGWMTAFTKFIPVHEFSVSDDEFDEEQEDPETGSPVVAAARRHAVEDHV